MSRFQRDITISDDSEVYTGKVSDNWSINGVPNGGYLMALMGNAILKESSRNAPVLFTANYLGRTSPGAVSIRNEMMVQSKQFDRIQSSLYQNEKECIRSMVTLMDEYDSDAETRYEAVPPSVKPRSECQRMIPFPQYSIYSNVIALMEPSSFGWMEGNLQQNSEHRGWFRLKEEQSWDALSVMLAADAFPPPLLASQGLVAWVPTIELSVQIRRIPTTRWLKCVFRSKYITGGLVEEDGEIWDENGNLIAISRQLAQFRRGPESRVQTAGLKAVSKVMAADRWLRKRKND